MSKPLESLIHAYARERNVDLPAGNIIREDIFDLIDSAPPVPVGASPGTKKTIDLSKPVATIGANQTEIKILNKEFYLTSYQVYDLLGAISNGRIFGQVRMVKDGQVIRFYDELNSEVDSLYAFYAKNPRVFTNVRSLIEVSDNSYKHLVHCIQTNFKADCGLENIYGNKSITFNKKVKIAGYSLLMMLDWPQMSDDKLQDVDAWLAGAGSKYQDVIYDPAPVAPGATVPATRKPLAVSTVGAPAISFYQLLKEIVTELNKPENDQLRKDLFYRTTRSSSRSIDRSKYDIVARFRAPHFAMGYTFGTPVGRLYGGDMINPKSIADKLEKQYNTLLSVIRSTNKPAGAPGPPGRWDLAANTQTEITNEIANIRAFEDRIKQLKEDVEQLNAVAQIVRDDLKKKDGTSLIPTTTTVLIGGAITNPAKNELKAIFDEFSNIYGKMSKSINRVIVAFSNGYILLLAPKGATAASLTRPAPLKPLSAVRVVGTIGP